MICMWQIWILIFLYGFVQKIYLYRNTQLCRFDVYLYIHSIDFSLAVTKSAPLAVTIYSVLDFCRTHIHFLFLLDVYDLMYNHRFFCSFYCSFDFSFLFFLWVNFIFLGAIPTRSVMCNVVLVMGILMTMWLNCYLFWKLCDASQGVYAGFPCSCLLKEREWSRTELLIPFKIRNLCRSLRIWFLYVSLSEIVYEINCHCWNL